MCTDALPVFSAQSGRRVWGRSAVQHCAPRVFRDKPKGWYAAEVLWKQSGVVSSSPGPAAGGRRRASLSLLRFWKAGVLPRRPAPGPGGARRRRLRARRKPAPLLLEARPGLPALLAAPGGAQGGQALRAPPAGRAERPCRAPGRLRLLGIFQFVLQVLKKTSVAKLKGNPKPGPCSAFTNQRSAPCAPERGGEVQFTICVLRETQEHNT